MSITVARQGPDHLHAGHQEWGGVHCSKVPRLPFEPRWATLLVVTEEAEFLWPTKVGTVYGRLVPALDHSCDEEHCKRALQ